MLAMADPHDDILTAAEAIKLLGIGRNTVYRYCDGKTIPHRRVGRRLLFSRAALLEWMKGKGP